VGSGRADVVAASARERSYFDLEDFFFSPFELLFESVFDSEEDFDSLFESDLESDLESGFDSLAGLSFSAAFL
jgi:hypothetical protein